MSLRNGSIKLAHRAARQVDLPIAVLPAFLCPGLAKLPRAPHSTSCFQYRQLSTTSQGATNPNLGHLSFRAQASGSKSTSAKALPQQCPGCGALSQTLDKEDPGFYALNRRSVRNYIEGTTRSKQSQEDEIIANSLKALGSSQEATGENRQIIIELGSAIAQKAEPAPTVEIPLCDRCHFLKNENTGVSIHHPSIQSIQDTIFESPYKYNHIYHVIDAADFPMSLVAGLYKLLHLTPQRSLNRRSKTGRFYHGRKTEISFIITRSDLLAPKKEQVDKLMPYMRSVLRDALGRAGKDARLGNVRCVSSKRQWWTKDLKEEIWNRGGGGWMVGKVNVGKSQLFHEVFPKGRMLNGGKLNTPELSPKDLTVSLIQGKTFIAKPTEDLAGLQTDPALSEGASQATQPAKNMTQEPPVETSDHELVAREESELAPEEAKSPGPEPFKIPESTFSPQLELARDEFDSANDETDYLPTISLLPPSPIETQFPTMPLISALPGTTASPIRLPFGSGKGELIDLPGLSRGDLELHIQPEHRSTLVMRSRIQPIQQTIKPGKSLLLGGFIRITPVTSSPDDAVVLAYNFTPIKEHLTSTEKAVEIQEQRSERNVANISIPGTGENVKSAGKFYLKYDVTKARTGPITRRDAAGINPSQLPYRVLAIDLLIEGVGWVELVAQVRKPHGYLEKEEDEDGEFEEHEEFDPSWPEIEVFTPEGRFVGQRRPMNAWVLCGEKPGKKGMIGRPRKAMKGVKKGEKRRAREGFSTPV